MGWVWILIICVVAAILLVAVMRWFLAGGRRRSPGRELPDRQPRN